MNSNIKMIRNGIIAGAALLMTACASESINEPSAVGIPQASDYQIGISVDDLNNVELDILDRNGNRATGVYPIWYVNESTRPSTSLTYRDLIAVAGEYPVEMKVGNSNGVSDGSVTGTITITKTIFDFAPYMRGLTNGSSKQWAVDGTKDGNMGCGPDGSNPTGWWNGGPGAKEEEGVYENILTFAENGEATSGLYTFDPGTAGTFYANTGIHSLPGYTFTNPDNGVDFRVNCGVVNTTFALSAEGASLYLVLPPDTPFPYVPSEVSFSNPRYRIAAFSRNEITLVQDLDGISWQYIITPKAEAEEDVTTTGFKYDYEHNLWKNADITLDHTWFADGGWQELPQQPEVTITPTKGIMFHTPADMGNDQWQGQVHVNTNIEVHADITYDFSCNVNVPKSGPVTVKVQKEGDDDVYMTANRVDVEPDGSIVGFTDVKGFDGTLKLVFDFAGFGDCDIEVSDIVFKEHQYDDGTKIPGTDQAPTISDADNIFAGYQVVDFSTWFADGGWQVLPQQPELIFLNDGYSFIVPSGMGGDQWQGQVHIWTNVETSADNKYDFMLTLQADKDVRQVTVKIQKGDSLGNDTEDDNVFISLDRIDVEAGEPCAYFFKAKQGIDTKNLQVCMDYAGAPEKTNITVSDIRMQISK